MDSRHSFCRLNLHCLSHSTENPKWKNRGKCFLVVCCAPNGEEKMSTLLRKENFPLHVLEVSSSTDYMKHLVILGE